jgi:hypothetical protein
MSKKFERHLKKRKQKYDENALLMNNLKRMFELYSNILPKR